MFERLLIVLLLVLLSSAVYLALKQVHLRRLNRFATIAGGGLQSAVGTLTLLYFGSDDCAACPTQARYLDQVAEMWSGRLSITKIDAAVEPEKAAQYRVFTLPTTMIMDAAGAIIEINYGLTNARKLANQLAGIEGTGGR